MRNLKRRIIWHQRNVNEDVSGQSHDSLGAAPGAMSEPHEASRPSLAPLMRRFGIPMVEDASDPREEAIELLRSAAEVEHALMIEYLFAMYSLKNKDDFFETIKRVALQEMGHLMTVQNLLLAIRAQCYFGRQDQSPQPDLDPFPFMLDAFNEITLAKAVAAEMPDIASVPSEDQDLVKRIVEIANEAVGEDINRVGLLYAKIYWLFQTSDTPEGPFQFDTEEIVELKAGSVLGHISDEDFEDPAILQIRQAKIEEFGGLGATVVGIEDAGDRVKALSAIHEVMEEGESPIAASNSHFSEFLRLFKSFEVDPPETHRVRTNPKSSEYGEGTTTRHLSDLFDVRYELMLLDFHLWLSLSREGDDQHKRTTLAQFSHAEMQNGITALNGVLVKREITEQTDGISPEVAIGTFKLPEEPFPEDFADRLAHMDNLTKRAQDLVDHIVGDDALSQPDKDKVLALKRLDEFRSGFIAENALSG